MAQSAPASLPLLELDVMKTFIAIAETSGLIDDVARFVLQQACQAIAQWGRQRPGRLELVAVNLSAAQLSQPWLAFALSIDS